MQTIHGIHFPDGERHFRKQLDRNPIIDGKGTYQYPKVLRALETVGERRGVAIDIGAHVGLWSRILAMHFSEVFAFEPVPAHADCFEINLADAQNVTLNRCALGATGGVLRIRQTADNTGAACVDPDGEIATPMWPLDVLCLEPDLIKIDVEGFEHAVLRGAEATIRSHKPVIVVEQKGNEERYGNARFAAVDLLKAWGATVAWEMKGDFCLVWP